MSEPFVFDPRHSLCKTPFGAVPCGESVTLHCRPLASDGFQHCAVVLLGEFSGTESHVELSRGDPEGDRVRFSGSVSAPSEPELIWYHFRFWRDDGTGCILDSTGYRTDGLVQPWQLTVYEETPTPQWFGEGVSYQIFPDRFCRLAIPDPAGLVGDRWVHENWADAPEWRPDPDGEVRNRDFFGGSLEGITSKLPYLADLGVTTLYLCPIFESASNHRYNTADYSRIDPMLGTEEDFRSLCARAGELGIRVILDGVFNHTGSQSLYFNEDGFYPTLGAAQSPDSPYAGWFSFHPWPTDYDAWWGIRTLPAVREECPSYIGYIIEGEDSIIRRWLRAGAGGWRLDVADELPDWFIEKIRAVMDRDFPDAFLLGEVWEDASTKVAYSRRRRYLLGRELHGVMNYPFRTSLLDYLRKEQAELFQEAMETLRENYPPAAFYSAMNFLGTHDTPRVLTVLGADVLLESREERAVYRLSPGERDRGLRRLRLAALVLFTFPGAPTVYYGDEAGMEGYEDPFNRGTYPWGGEDLELRSWFRTLGRLRRDREALRRGGLRWLHAAGPLLAFARETEAERLAAVVNASLEEQSLSLPWPGGPAEDLLTGRRFVPAEGGLDLSLPPLSGLLLAEIPET
nr:glycoside hydrolase family 13 protein [uncultured Oscillibacter sp.]